MKPIMSHFPLILLLSSFSADLMVYAENSTRGGVLKEAVSVAANILTITSKLNCNAPAQFTSGMNISGELRLSGGLTIHDRLLAQDSVTITSDLMIENNLTIKGSITGSTSFTAFAADNFTGPLSGDVTGTQSATVLSKVGSLAGSAGVVHNDSSGVLSSSLIVNSDVSPSAAISYSKLNLSNSIVNADINSAAAIPYSKLTLTNSIVNADVNSAAAITYSKLNLANSITNNDISSSAAIAYSKLNLTNSIVNGDISSSAAIADTKLATISTAGKVANSATSATSSNSPSTIVLRDASGNFSAKTISLDGNFVIIGTQESPPPARGYIYQNGSRLFSDINYSVFLGINSGKWANNANSAAVGIGQNVMQNTDPSSVFLLVDMIGVGDNALSSYLIGENGLGNIAIGFASLASLTTGTTNTAIGRDAGFGLTNGGGNTFIGSLSGLNLTNGDYNIYFNQLGINGESSTTRVGGPLQNRFFAAGVYGTTTGSATTANLIVDDQGQLGTTASSRRFKEHISPLDQELISKIIALRPVRFNYRNDAERTIQYGLIAEEALEEMPELIAYLEDGSVYSVRYQLIAPLLLHMWQNQQRRISTLQQEIDQLCSSLSHD